MWYLIEITEKNLNVVTCKISETKPTSLANKEILSTHKSKLQAIKELAEQRCDFYMIEMSKYTIDEIDELSNKPKQKDLIQLKQICKNN